MNEQNVKNLIVIFLAVVLLFVIFYFLTKPIAQNVRPQFERAETQIQTETILVGNILNRSLEEYYVLVTDRSDVSYGRNREILDELKDSGLIQGFYIVDLDEPFNRSFVSDEPNLDVERASEFLFDGPTLLKISDRKVENHFSGPVEIASHLTSF